MDRAEHGARRAGLITASIARVVMHGGAGAWDTLVQELFADTGERFAAPSVGACAHGHRMEPIAKAKFWERNPGMDIDEPDFERFQRRGYAKDHPYRQLLACSPDFGVLSLQGQRLGGGEVKSPVDVSTYYVYASSMQRGKLPHEHEDQVRFSLFVTGWETWYFVTHHGELYEQLPVYNGTEAQKAWESRFKPRVDAFIDLYLHGRRAERDKLGGGDLAKLLG